MASGRGRRGHGGKEEGNSERWLLTYADMITLLMALFMVLFSISSVNISKFRTLQKALRDAFSGQVLPGGKALQQTGSNESAKPVPEASTTASVMPFAVESNARVLKSVPGASQAAAKVEQSSLARVQREVKAYIAEHHLSSSVTVSLERRGLVVTLLTDKLLFPSGQATLSTASFPLLEEMAKLINIQSEQPVAVAGNTDSAPIETTQFPSNWELSSARADSIVRFLVGQGVAAGRLTSIGYADQRPVASNATEAGRALNRRVQIVLERRNQQEGGEEAPSQSGQTLGAEAKLPTESTPAAESTATTTQSVQSSALQSTSVAQTGRSETPASGSLTGSGEASGRLTPILPEPGQSGSQSLLTGAKAAAP